MRTWIWRPRAAFGIAIALLAALTPAAGRAANEEAVEARLRRDVTFLASDECEGRGVGTKGLDRAADYLADQFARIGLKPARPDGYFQPFPVASASVLEGESAVTLRGPEGKTVPLKQGTDFQVIGLSGGGKASGPLVFVGYGISARDAKYDDYQGVDVKGKVAVLIRRTPRWEDKHRPFDSKRQNEHAALETKLGLAEANGAAAVILVNDASEADDGLIAFQTTARAMSNSRVPFVHVRRKALDAVLRAGLNRGLGEIEKEIDRDLKPQSAALPGWAADLDVKVKRTQVTVKNVVGVLEGAGPLADETVVVGAHYDHLGYGGLGSRAKDPKKKQIHHGADDNASGTAALLELARRFADDHDRQGRRLVFIAFTAEESGLIGSRYYAKRDPIFPLKSTAAMFNLDMVGRLQPNAKTEKDKLLIEGSGTAKGFDALLEKLNPGFELSKKPGGNGPSDHDSFYNQKVPVVFFWTGVHEDYHRPSDTADKINVAGMRRVTDYAEKVIARLAADPHRPEYVEVASSFSPGVAKGPRLGIMPDYEENKEGVTVGGVSKDGPAAKAGVQTGDLIVELGGRPVTNLNTYMVIMGQQRAGQALGVTVVRDGKKVQLKVVPQ